MVSGTVTGAYFRELSGTGVGAYPFFGLREFLLRRYRARDNFLKKIHPTPKMFRKVCGSMRGIYGAYHVCRPGTGTGIGIGAYPYF